MVDDAVPDMDDPSCGMSFHEKSAWAQLLTTGGIYTAYFTLLWQANGVQGLSLGLFIGAVVVQVIAMVVLHIAFAVTSEEHEPDERDRDIERRADNIGSLCMSFGVMSVVLLLLPADALGTELARPAFLIGNALLAIFVLSQLVANGLQVLYYRRGL